MTIVLHSDITLSSSTTPSSATTQLQRPFHQHFEASLAEHGMAAGHEHHRAGRRQTDDAQPLLVDVWGDDGAMMGLHIYCLEKKGC